MESIFHEKQEGSLCAQHCLNALLQGSYFTPVELATLAQQMDEEERKRMAESGINSEDYRKFLEQPSGNMDDSGFFSIQVISCALEVWGLELVPLNSADDRVVVTQHCPQEQQAYICNYREHWFTIRKIGNQWFNLNSLLSGPELLSDTYLAMFLAQLQQEGYSIFVVFGTLPECDADALLRLTPAIQSVKPKLLTESKPSSRESKKDSDSLDDEDDEEQLKLALRMSIQEMDEEEEALQVERLIKLTSQKGASSEEPDITGENEGIVKDKEAECDLEEEEELRKALQMSLECCEENPGPSREPTIEELRQKRLALLDRVDKKDPNS